MNILFVGSEAAPFVKTGGLGDVVSSLPKYLQRAGAQVKLILPLYSVIDRNKFGLKKIFDCSCVKMGNCEEFYSVHYAKSPANYDVYFIEFNKYFDRPYDGYGNFCGVYAEKYSRKDYDDNAYRYAFFCKAALQTSKDLGFRPDVVHVHDWQTALMGYFLKKNHDPFFAETKSVLTIHNLPYQGIYNADVIPYAGIDWQDFNMNAFENYGRINLLKGGIFFADKITTVSPHYAQEILSPIGGAGLHWLLNQRKNDLSGILNGIDLDLWDPKNDPHVAYPYDLKKFKEGKKENKRVLRERFGLNQDHSPVFSMTIRLSEQKGIRMFTECIEGILKTMHAQVIVMGDGDPWAEDYLSNLPHRYSGQFSVRRFNGATEHLVDAGSDFTLVPSIYEPCGLKQMYSQLYGTLPIVRSTGGLADTVENYDESVGGGTGFKFYDISAKALYDTIGWANSTYYDRPHHIDNMIKKAMKQDFSWNKSATQYLNLYQQVKSA